MGSVGAERRRPTPAQTPEERDVWRDGGRSVWREGWREGRESGIVQSYSFDSYQLEEEEISKDAPERGVLALSEPDFEEPIPDDRYHGIYFAMLLAGVGFLLPYNSFITDVDYLHQKFKGTSIVFDMSLTYILVALLAVILNNVLVERLSMHTRITVGYILALGPLIFVSVFDVWLEKFTTKQAYVINLVSVGVVAFGCTVQQSSFYGYMGMLPKRYTQGVMTGESTAGVIISLSRIFTKLLIKDDKKNTLIFFLVSISMEMLCFLLHLLVRRSRFVRYYTSHAQGKGPGKCHDPRDNGTGYRVHHDVTAEEVRFGNGGTGASSVEEGVEDIAGGTYVRFDAPKAKMRRSWPGLRDMILHRYVVSRVIWAYMLSIAVTYSITLCLFPGLESEIRNSTLGEWLPILIMATFNMSDFVGKILAALPYDWSGGRLLFFSCLRVVFIPLFVMCVYPANEPTLSHPAWPCLFSLLMGVTNGYFGSVPMIQAAGKVPPEQRELAGNTMTVSYMTGLMVGSAVAYAAYSFTAPPTGIHSSTLNIHTPANTTVY
ncbi:equilibrative nucleoside transporter 4 isoform X1 [Maylandia zebra]|uniref:Equilibrative nucleoside transporter 4 n=4 Tax=Haplochromini TaxID=319058 RepID=A0A3P9BJS0_9CICH|nr:equilibrative nucleoside transporter 4 isoform X1 [Maylandia zebra]XP_013768888.1 PREDICTED: equilibrative nucleoside transporter 4 isoform X1 [Pundamilia nyererei]XP_014196810.1 equilibrative nucleoside transporter 4 isoform X1 [Haplochromis burtoni]XP_014196811.1 equilibrative nucleoside transporter 4 isoform X1 [Haplochromis burtoni]XP_026021292.1 equilibrative nucleoside transporter 4 isoform X1 [Astatotilapia calliptera]XP_026021293.1 equilibrative nucleoside transporter 4 isoform X1 [